MEILSAEQIRYADRYTIENTPIRSIDLMERAAMACIPPILEFAGNGKNFHIFCGPGNNGGDGLAIARLLLELGHSTAVTVLSPTGKFSPDCMTNLERYRQLQGATLTVTGTSPASVLVSPDEIIIDAIFGTGLNQEVTGEFAKLIRSLNLCGQKIISIDMPSGLFCDSHSPVSSGDIVRASLTLTFQYPKLALLVAENYPFTGKVEILNIGLMKEANGEMQISQFLSDREWISPLLNDRPAFSHKGTFGHGLIIAGGLGKMGAAVLSANSYLRSGAGLLTMMVPKNREQVIFTAAPEAMVETYEEGFYFTDNASDKYSVIGVGPGLGTGPLVKSLIESILRRDPPKLVFDADAINVIASDRSLVEMLPGDTILTPHPGEFRRLCGNWENDFEKLTLQKNFAARYKVYLVLKGKNTSIATPDGKIFFNSTGNPGMAKGGSGDVLTGLITGLRARGYNALHSCLIGTYLHGLAGDVAADQFTEEGMNAGDIIRCLPNAWHQLLHG